MRLFEEIRDRNRKTIEAVILTDEEKEEGVFDRKTKKFFNEKNAEYWHDKEFGDNQKTKQISI